MYNICMKILRSYTIDAEIAEELKKVPNASNLINELLKDYFKNHDINQLSLEELRLKQKIIEIQEEAQEKIRRAKNGEL